MKKNRFTALLLALAALLLCGCSSAASMDEYYALPRVAGEFADLQAQLDALLADGYDYISPETGDAVQAIQLADPDGDGQQEALVCLYNRSTGCAEIKFFKRYSGEYSCVFTAEGTGSAIRSMALANLMGGNGRQLAVLWKLTDRDGLLAVYDLRSWGGETLLRCPAEDFIPVEAGEEGKSDLAAVSVADGMVKYISFRENEEPAIAECTLSHGAARLEHFRECRIADGRTAILAESTEESGVLLTDLFLPGSAGLKNIAVERGFDVSAFRRSYAVYSCDVDGDGILEVPFPTSLFSQSGGGTSYSILWYACKADGSAENKLETFHCNSDGWFFDIPAQWHGSLTVRREDSIRGERSVVLSEVNRSTGEITDRLIIYTLTGDRREERAALSGRFVLEETESTVYAAHVLADISQEEVLQRFHRIDTDWSNGSLS